MKTANEKFAPFEEPVDHLIGLRKMLFTINKQVKKRSNLIRGRRKNLVEILLRRVTEFIMIRGN